MKLLLLALLLSCFLLPSLSSPNNISAILQSHPDFSTFLSLLSQSGVASQINSRSTITVLAPSNSVLDPIVHGGSSFSAQTLFNILSFHVLLDYFDLAKLKAITNGTTLSTTLYQTTGLAIGNQGSVNITDEGGAAHIGRADPGAPLSAVVQSEIYTNPYNISVLSISAVLIPDGAGAGAPAPAVAPVNISLIVSQAKNYNTFLSLIKATGVDALLQKRDVPPGLTLFCPDDAAFSKLPAGALAKLSNAQKVALLEFHALGSYYSSQQLSTLNQPQNTLASGTGGGYQYAGISLNKSGSPVIDTGFNKVAVGPTLYSQEPVAIYGISTVLLPTDLFGLAPKSAPTPSPASSPTPASAPSSASTPSLAPASSPTVSPSTAPASSSSPPSPSVGSPGGSSLGSPAPGQPSSAPPLHVALGLLAALPLAASMFL